MFYIYSIEYFIKPYSFHTNQFIITPKFLSTLLKFKLPTITTICTTYIASSIDTVLLQLPHKHNLHKTRD